MKSIPIAKGTELPLDAVNRRIAVLGMQGSGKSNTAAVIVENFLTIGAQTVILDNDGSWYGLRLSASGKSKGFDIPVFGGLHGDIPLDFRAGALIADLIVDRGISVILDVSMFRKGQRHQFATDFAEQLFHRKKEHRSPMCFVVEEAQDFIPQNVKAEQARMLGAFEDLGKGARKYGVGLMIVSQRPQSVNKEVLNQAEVLFVHQTMGSHERKALSEWIVDKGMDKSLVEEIASLAIGEAYVWSPRWLKKIERVQVPLKKTYDSAATPEFGKTKTVAPKSLDPLDLKQLEQDMQQVIQQASENDPKALKKKIVLMQAEMDGYASMMLELQKRQPEVRIERVEVPVISDEQIRELRYMQTSIHDLSNFLEGVDARISAIVDSVKSRPIPAPSGGRWVQVSPSDPSVPAVIRRSALARGVFSPDELADPGIKIDPGQRKCLTAIAQYPDVTIRELSVLTGYKVKSCDTYVSRLRKSGLLTVSEDGFLITGRGWDVLGPFEPLPSGRALLDHWLSKLTGGERVILELLWNRGPLPRGEIATVTGYKLTSVDTYLGRLSAKRLVEIKSHKVSPSPSLFD